MNEGVYGKYEISLCYVMLFYVSQGMTASYDMI